MSQSPFHFNHNLKYVGSQTTPTSNEHRCPRCNSDGVRVAYPNIECQACGYHELLIDLPISWNWHRYHHFQWGPPDPSSCDPTPRPELKAIEERLGRQAKPGESEGVAR